MNPDAYEQLDVQDFSGGLKQDSPAGKNPPTHFLRFKNARVCSDKISARKRAGLSEFDADYSFGNTPVLGCYGIYDKSALQSLVCLPTSLRLKAAGLWSTIFSPTKEVDSQVSICQYMGVTFVGGYENLIAVLNGDADYAGLAAPTESPVINLVAATGEVEVETFAEGNVDKLGQLRQNVARTLIAQSFKATKAVDVANVKLYLRKVGAPTGHIWAEIHSGTSGTSGTKNASSSIVGQASAEVDVSTLTTTLAQVTLTFSGTKPNLALGSSYFIVIYGDFTVSTSAFVLIGFDSSSPSYMDGKYYEVESGMTWSGNDNVDLIFEVNGVPTDEELAANAGTEETGYGDNLRTSGANAILAQPFTVTKEIDLKKVILSLSKFASPTGNLWAEIHSRTDTAIRVKANAGDLTIEVDDTTGMIAGDKVGIILDDFLVPAVMIHWTSVQSVTDGDTLVITDAIPAGRSASVDNVLFFQKVTSLTKNTSAGIVGLASDNLSVASVIPEPDASSYTFTFTSSMPNLTAGKTYYIMLYGDFTISATAYVRWSQTVPVVGEESYKVSSAGLFFSWGDKTFCFEAWGYDVQSQIAGTYVAANLDTYNGLRETTSQTLLAQSFLGTDSYDITKLQLYLAKVGSPTGNIWAEIHRSQVGTSGSKNSSTNQVGQASDSVNVSTLDAFPTFSLKTFTFSGTKPTIVEDGTYYLVVYGDFAVSASAFVKVGMDRDSPDPDSSGNLFDIDGSYAWTAKTGAALAYHIWAIAGDIPGTRKYVVTFYRGGNYPVESNPSPESLATEILDGYYAHLTGIPVSSDSRVTARNIYRTEDEGETFLWLGTIPDNTTTTFDDAVDDADISGNDEVEYDNDRPPAGDSIESWDGRLWVSNGTEYLYPSKAGRPEQFDITAALALREKQASPIVRIKEFQNDLSALKRNSIWCVQRSGDSYIADKVVSDTGLGARNSVIEADGVLIFLSNHKKIEMFDGKKVITPRVSDAVAETLKTINATFMYRSVAEHYVPDNEYRLAIPTGDNEWPDTVIVYDYARQAFSIDEHESKKISSICVTDVEPQVAAMVYGTSLGQLLTVDDVAEDDAGLPIVMDIQTAWFGEARFRHLRRIYIDFALDEGLALTFRVYANYEASARLEKTLTGNTPAGDSPLLRDTIQKMIKMNVQGSFFSFRFIQATSATRFILSRLKLILRKRLARGDIQAD